MTKNKTKINRFFCFIFLAIFRAMLIIFAYLVEAIMYLSEFVLWLLHRIGQPLGIRVRFFEDGVGDSTTTFTEKFSKDDIEALAKKVNPDATIKEIEGELGVSYRQARKVKEASRNPLSINQYGFTNMR